jgi:N-methylhydantoinase A/oxoprolinase/acetone carboxylase beta subunit
LGIREIIVPPRPGVLAAEGLLHAPVEEERHVTFFRSAVGNVGAALRGALEDLAAQARGKLAESGGCDAAYVRHAADMRYSGQSYELEVAIDLAETDPVAGAVHRFHEAHRIAYGRAQESETVEFVNLRAVAGRASEAPSREPARQGPHEAPQPQLRIVSFSADAGPAQTPVFARSSLPAGWRIKGPAVIEQADTTTIVYPGQDCRVHDSGALILTWEGAA